MKNLKRLIAILACMVLALVGSAYAQGDVSPDFTHHPPHVCEYLTKHYPYALSTYIEFGVPISLTLAVGAYESGYGKSFAAKEKCNFFGLVKGNMPFNNMAQCYRFWGYLLTTERYRKIHALPHTNWRMWCHSLGYLGYNPRETYGDSLIEVIEYLKLYELDLKQ